MEVGQGPNWGSSAKEKKKPDGVMIYELERIWKEEILA
jgi:hypothetical protein